MAIQIFQQERSPDIFGRVEDNRQRNRELQAQLAANKEQFEQELNQRQNQFQTEFDHSAEIARKQEERTLEKYKLEVDLVKNQIRQSEIELDIAEETSPDRIEAAKIELKKLRTESDKASLEFKQKRKSEAISDANNIIRGIATSPSGFWNTGDGNGFRRFGRDILLNQDGSLRRTPNLGLISMRNPFIREDDRAAVKEYLKSQLAITFGGDQPSISDAEFEEILNNGSRLSDLTLSTELASLINSHPHGQTARKIVAQSPELMNIVSTTMSTASPENQVAVLQSLPSTGNVQEGSILRDVVAPMTMIFGGATTAATIGAQMLGDKLGDGLLGRIGSSISKKYSDFEEILKTNIDDIKSPRLSRIADDIVPKKVTKNLMTRLTSLKIDLGELAKKIKIEAFADGVELNNGQRKAVMESIDESVKNGGFFSRIFSKSAAIDGRIAKLKPKNLRSWVGLLVASASIGWGVHDLMSDDEVIQETNWINEAGLGK